MKLTNHKSITTLARTAAANIIDWSSLQTIHFFEFVHGLTGLSWSLSIPLSVIVLRGIPFVLFNLPARMAIARSIVYQPVSSHITVLAVHAGALQKQKRMLKQTKQEDNNNNNNNNTAAHVFSSLPLPPLPKLTRKETKKTVSDAKIFTKKQFRYGWKWYLLPVLSVFPFMCSADALRRMSGAQITMLQRLKSFITGEEVSVDDQINLQSTNDDDVGGANVVKELNKDTANLVTASHEAHPPSEEHSSDLPTTTTTTTTTHQFLEPSFVDGGALWFTNLTCPDPTLILNVILAVIVWFTIRQSPLFRAPSESAPHPFLRTTDPSPKLLSSSTFTQSAGANPPQPSSSSPTTSSTTTLTTHGFNKPIHWNRIKTVLRRLTIPFCIFLIPMTSNFPVAVSLYSISNFSFMLGMGKILDKYAPLPRSPMKKGAAAAWAYTPQFETDKAQSYYHSGRGQTP